MRHLILRLEAPLMSFGGIAFDSLAPTHAHPTTSMLTGLIGNALGWRREESKKLQMLQDRLVFASRIERESAWEVVDFQTAHLSHTDTGWTYDGPEGRKSSPPTFQAPSLRYRHYHADMRVSVAIRLRASRQTPTLDVLGDALQAPKRPLSIGRRPCLPTSPLFGGFVAGDTTLQALLNIPVEDQDEPPAFNDTIKLSWPESEGPPPACVQMEGVTTIPDLRNWRSTLHGGQRRIFVGTIPFSQLKELS